MLNISFLSIVEQVGCITRLVPQKGVHLIRHAIYRTLELGGQFILLGSSPVPHIQVISYCVTLFKRTEFPFLLFLKLLWYNKLDSIIMSQC